MRVLVNVAQISDLNAKIFRDECWLGQEHKNEGGHRSEWGTQGKSRSEAEYEEEHKDSATKLNLLD
jgi:hypothetical protein